MERDNFVREGGEGHQTINKKQSHFNTLRVYEKKIMRPYTRGREQKIMRA